MDFELQFAGLVLQCRFVVLDLLLDLLDGGILGLEPIELLLGRVTRAVLQIIYEGFQGLLDNGGRDLFIFVGLIVGDLLRSFHGLGQIGLQFTDTSFQFFNGVRITPKKFGDQIFVRDERCGASPLRQWP